MTDSADLHFARFCADGNPAELGEVFDATALELLSVAEHLTHDLATAEDLLQSTFLVAMESAPRFRPGERVRPWLVGILQNLARRPALRRRSAPIPSGTLIPATASAAHTAAAHETSSEVETLVNGLPAPYREVVELRLFSGYSNSGIANRLHRPAGTVRAQLSRGLAMLRQSLPAGITAGVAGIPDLATMRTKIVHAAKTSSPVAATSLVTSLTAGLLVKTKVAVTLAALFIGSITWWSVTHEPSLPESQAAATRTETGQIEKRSPSPTAEEPTTDREAITPTPRLTFTPTQPSSAPVDRKQLRVLVVDAEGRPVSGATIVLSGPQGLGGLFGFNSLAGKTLTRDLARLRQPPPTESRTTNDTGEAKLDVHPLHSRVSVTKPSIGESGTLDIPTGMLESAGRWRIVLIGYGSIQGRVLDRFGAGVAGATVVASHGPKFAMAKSTADGRYSVDIPRAGTYRLYAKSGEKKSDTEFVVIDQQLTPATQDLSFPGAYTITGFVRDPHGAPATDATVQAWRLHEAPEAGYPFVKNAKVDADGRFEIAFGQAGKYRVNAVSVAFANSEVSELELTPRRRRSELTLGLLEFAEIRGRVLGVSGEPLVGRRVSVDIGLGGDSTGKTLRSIYGPDPFKETETDNTGTFAIEGLHPGATYGVTVFLDLRRYRLTLSEPAVKAGTTDLILQAEAGVEHGTRVHARVIDASTRQPVKGFGVRLWKFYDDKKSYPEEVPLDRDASARGEFTVKDLALNGEYSLVVQAPGYAPLLSPRFRMDKPTRTMELAVERYIDVTLLLPPSSLAQAARHQITVRRQPPHPEPLGISPLSADRAGRATLRLPPGKYRASSGTLAATFEVKVGIGASFELR